jgi:serine/threonine protein kinase/tetratricopeptide (TPR) repeat protein
MTGDDTTRAKDLFLDALELEGATRESFLSEACGEDTELRRRVDELLDAHGSSERVVGHPIRRLSRIEGIADLDVGDTVGPYVLRERLGEGGFGVVFRADQTSPVRRPVALKVVKLGMDTKAVVARFETERQALALMDHPSISRVYDAGATESGRPYFAMELVDGVPITDHCAQNELGTKARLELFRTVCHAVQHAHQKGVVHRDLKPTNVLVGEVDGGPLPKVIDFGIAKATGEALTEKTFFSTDGQLVGTPAYMSPEQAAGSADVDTRTDVYALGVLLYELLAGAPPFDARALGFLELQQSIRDVDPPRPSTQRRKKLAERAGLDPHLATGRVRLEVPADLDWIAMRCLEKDPGRRYPTAFALAADVERFLDERPVEAVPPSFAYRVRKTVLRHRVATVAGLLVLVSLVLGAVGTVAGLVEAGRANAELGVRNDELADALVLAREESERARRAELLAAEEAREARRQAEVARAINAFLTDDLLGAVAPSAERGRGRDVSMREVLDAAGLSIERAAEPEGRFAELPQVEAAIRHALGNTYFALGEYTPSAEHLERAYRILVHEKGLEDRDLLAAQSDFALALRWLGRIDEGMPLLEEVVASQRAVLGPADPDTLESVSRLASMIQAGGDLREGAALLEESLEDARAEGLGEHPATQRLVAALAINYTELGKLDEAEPLFRWVVEIRERDLGHDHPDTLSARTNLATFYYTTQDFEKAEHHYRDLLATSREVMGSDHPATISLVSNLGDLLSRMLERDEAAPLLEEAYRTSRRVYDEDHENTYRAMGALGTFLREGRDYESAERVLRTALKGHEEARGPDHPWTIAIKRELTRVLHEMGRDADAEPVLREILASKQRRYGPDHGDTLLVLIDLGVTLHALGRDDEAEAFYLEALPGVRRAFGDEHPATVRLLRNLATVCLVMERYDEAELYAREAVERGRAVLGGDANSVIERGSLLVRLGQALVGQGRTAEAEEAFVEAVELLRRIDPRMPWTRMAAEELVALYEASGRAEVAEELLRNLGLGR